LLTLFVGRRYGRPVDHFTEQSMPSQGGRTRVTTGNQAFGGVVVGGAGPLFPAAVRHGDLLFLSGQAPIDPTTKSLCANDFATQAAFVMDSIGQTLASAGANLADVLRVECILADAEDFAGWNELYARVFPPPRPARTTFVASFVVPGMLLEVQVTAGL
jgi:2-iminobutanoate/2-iminopropanoate deaminase